MNHPTIHRPERVDLCASIGIRRTHHRHLHHRCQKIDCHRRWNNRGILQSLPIQRRERARTSLEQYKDEKVVKKRDASP